MLEAKLYGYHINEEPVSREDALAAWIELSGSDEQESVEIFQDAEEGCEESLDQLDGAGVEIVFIF